MRVIFLGTNGWFDTATGNTTCILIETNKEYIILDAGNGLYKIDNYIKKKKPIYMFLSHFHLDHIIGLHILNKFNFIQGINIYGPKGIKKFLTTIINKPFTMPIKQLNTKIKLQELNRKIPIPVNLDFKRLLHPSLCYGYRFYLENKIISYCTDTGICKNLFMLAKNADLLISEASYKSEEKNRSWIHLNPEEAAKVAKKSEVKKLILIHFDASIYRNLRERKNSEVSAKRIFKNTFAAVDNIAFEI